ncbi:MAG: LysR family transcriptional regulator [Rhodospirillaceae bacterium]|nr:LysR family transcriptional regulator [Rhodospirillaceae bacterium]
MELRQLKHFLAVVDTGSFSAAAKLLGLTQQALSKSIASLEDTTGVRLFDRDTRNLSLTQFGEMLASHARNIDAEAQQFHRHVDDVLGVKSGRLMIGAGPTAAGHIVAAAVQRLTAARPKLRISVIDGNTDTLTPMMLRGALDVIVCVQDDPRDNPLVISEVISQEPVRLLAGASHPLVQKNGPNQRKVKLAQTLDHPWMLGWRTATMAKNVNALFAAHKLKAPTAALNTTSVTFARAVLSHGQHLAVLPEHLFAPELASGALSVIPLDADLATWANPITLSYRRNSTRSPATMSLVTQLYAVAGDLGAKPPQNKAQKRPAKLAARQ